MLEELQERTVLKKMIKMKDFTNYLYPVANVNSLNRTESWPAQCGLPFVCHSNDTA